MVRVASHFSEIVLSKLLEKLKASMNRLYEERERISCNMGHIIWRLKNSKGLFYLQVFSSLSVVF